VTREGSERQAAGDLTPAAGSSQGRNRARAEIGPLYASMGRSFAEMCSRYDEGELALILDFVRRSHPLNRKRPLSFEAGRLARREVAASSLLPSSR
jgi:hypothetical protein